MNRSRAIAIWVVAAAIAVVVAAFFIGHGRQESEEEKEKPIASSVAQVSHTAAGETIIALKRDSAERMGLETGVLAAANEPMETVAYGEVLDPSPLVSLNSQLLSAEATLAASKAQFERSRRLYRERDNVSLRDFQSAQAKFQTDQAQGDALRQQFANEWGQDIAAMNATARAALIEALVKRTMAIVRVSLPPGHALGSLPVEARMIVLGHETTPLITRLITYAPSVNPNLQGQGFLLRAETRGFPVRPGAAITAYLQISQQLERGVVIPHSAVVRYSGAAWVYEQIAPDKFTRREIILTHPTVKGWCQTAGFRPSLRVVVTGAQALLSEELKSQIQVQK